MLVLEEILPANQRPRSNLPIPFLIIRTTDLPPPL